MLTFWETDEMKSNKLLALIGIDGNIHVLHYDITSDKNQLILKYPKWKDY